MPLACSNDNSSRRDYDGQTSMLRASLSILPIQKGQTSGVFHQPFNLLHPLLCPRLANLEFLGLELWQLRLDVLPCLAVADKCLDGRNDLVHIGTDLPCAVTVSEGD